MDEIMKEIENIFRELIEDEEILKSVLIKIDEFKHIYENIVKDKETLKDNLSEIMIDVRTLCDEILHDITK